MEFISGIWVHENGNLHICTDAQIGQVDSGKRYSILEENAPEVIAARKAKRELEKRIAEQERQKEREKLIDKILPKYESQKGQEYLVLPQWLNDWIKSENAFYDANSTKSHDGTALSVEDVRWYLGTYFPKSFTEAYTIYSDLFSHDGYNDKIKNKKEISILDIGCGTGGDVIGLISAIIIKLRNVKTIKIQAYDYCENSLASLSKLISYFNELFKHLGISIDIETKKLQLAYKPTKEGDVMMSDFALSFSKNTYDIIATFKMLNELIRNAGFKPVFAYYNFASNFAPLLNTTGIMVIEDVSDKIDENVLYLSKPLNYAMTRFVNSNKEFKIISPVPCSIVNGNCNVEGCYSQRRLLLAFDAKYFENNVVSNNTKQQHIDTLITYKILARAEVASSVVPRSFECKYQKVYKRPGAKSTNDSDRFCYLGDEKDSSKLKSRDAFIITPTDE